MVNRVGTELGNYRLTRLLDTGGFAEVYLGEHIYLGTPAAIKVQLAQLSSQDKQKFYEEARNIARLIHPHIVRLLEFGVEGNTPFMVMDYAPNGTLESRYPQGTQVPLATIVSYIKEVADALQYAHDEKLIHRDIKPANMLVGRRNEILLSDFGIAVIAHSTRSQKTEEVIGTWTYAAPELFKGKPLPASDQYALGIVVYEWLCGFPPFQGSLAELYNQHLSVSPPSLRTKLATIPPLVEQVVLRVLAKDPQHRFTSVQEFASAFEQAYTTYYGPTKPAVVTPPTTPLVPQAVTPSYPKPTTTPRVGTTHFTYKSHASSSSSNAGITKVVWSPDGTQIASVSKDTTVQVWEAATGKKIISYSGHRSVVNDIAWSPDGKYIASAGNDKAVHVWETSANTTSATMNVEFIYGGHFAVVSAVAWSSDATHIASGDDEGNVHIWDLMTGYMVFGYNASTDTNNRSYAYTHSVNNIAWSPDGKRVVTGVRSGIIKICNLSNVTTIYDYFISNNYTGSYPRDYYSQNRIQLNAVVWSANGQVVAWGGGSRGEGTVVTIDSSTKKQIFSYRGHKNEVNALACSPISDRLASGSNDTTVQVWDARDGRNVFTYRGHSKAVTSLAWSPDGKYIASADADGIVLVWQAS